VFLNDGVDAGATVAAGRIGRYCLNVNVETDAGEAL
jgi:hypothetical protein